MNFALTLDDEQVPEVLRRVADAIEEIRGFALLFMVVHPCAGEATASVAYYVKDS